ncbi:MAG: prepilin-type N-terminal cleavage/methylation domain-containing protein [Candidatus Omnitrophota bacterium]|jgi:type IV pilus assembly protein PilE
MKKGFTLLELIIVIVVVGILATLGMQEYKWVLERGRSAEARANLSLLRRLQRSYFVENDKYATTSLFITDLGLPAGTDSNCNTSNEYYFKYSCGSNGTCSAQRCTSGGKPPVGPSQYSISLSIDGVLTGFFYSY